MSTHPWPGTVRFLAILCLAFLVLPARSQFAQAPTNCELCAKAFTDRYYTMMDKVLDKRRMVCGDCVQRPQRCFTCGLPIVKDAKSLADGRHYCARDAANALLAPADVQSVVTEAEARLRRQFQGEMEFPERNVGLTLVDRVNIEALFARPGHDYHCPNVLGYYQAKTNGTSLRHEVYLLSGLSASATRAVFAHELTHAWLAQHLPAGRQLSADTEEGFCELIAYLLQKELRDEAGMRQIAENKYTRGQFELFRQAQEAYNLTTVINWLQHGTEPLLPGHDLDVVRRAQKKSKASPQLWVAKARDVEPERAGGDETRPAGDEELRLKAVMGSEKRRTALINNRSFETGETGKLALAGTQREVRCLEIGADFARIEFTDGGGEKTLRLGEPQKP